MTDIDENNIRRMDGGLLLVFRGLMRRRRATLVARDLGLSQSAISHALARLRDLFGDPLFTRRSHGLEPTRRARELSPRIDTLIDMLDATLEREGQFDPAKSERRFVVSAPEFVTALIGAHLVSRFRKTAPRASFVVTFLSPSRAFEALNRGEVDVALGRFGALPKGMTAQPIFEDRYCVAARKGHPKLKGRITYAQYRSIGHVYAQSESEMAEEERSANTDDVAYTAFVPRWLTVLMIVATSDAIATCPRRLAERQAELMGLQVIKPPFVPDKISVSAVRRPGRADPGVDWLLAQIREAVSAPKAK